MVGTVMNINRATGEAAQASEGVAKQAESLAEYSKTLSELLSMFKLDSSEPAKNRY
jgi:methyl-accepting chemotaxis protein